MSETDVLAELLGQRPLTRPPGALMPSPVAVPAGGMAAERKLVPLLLSILAISLWIAAANFILKTAYAKGYFGTPPDAVVAAIIANGLIFAGMIAIAFGFDRWVRVPSAPDRMGLARAIPFGLALGLGGLLYGFACAWIGGHTVPAETTVATNLALMLVGGGVILFQTAAEEIFFRGWFQPIVSRGWGEIAALTVTSIAFAALHIFSGARDPLSFLNLVLAGLFFGLLAIRTRGIAAPIAAHFAWNGSEQLMVGLDPNPGIGAFGAIWDFEITGSALWGGSPEGLNSSIAITCALLAMVIPLAAWGRKSGAAQPA